MEFKFVQITNWPRKATATRKRSQFDSAYSDTLELLKRELRAIKARQPVIIQTYMGERDIRYDGLPRADARTPSSPGVVVTFDKWIPTGQHNAQGQALGKVTPFSFPCDQFTDWKDNLHAIALALEALRKVDRYGVTQNAEQYTGWKALPASGGLQSDMEAARVLCAHAQEPNMTSEAAVLGDPNVAKQVYRSACKRAHRDTDGTVEALNAVQVAWERIKQRHKL